MLWLRSTACASLRGFDESGDGGHGVGERFVVVVVAVVIVVVARAPAAPEKGAHAKKTALRAHSVVETPTARVVFRSVRASCVIPCASVCACLFCVCVCVCRRICVWCVHYHTLGGRGEVEAEVVVVLGSNAFSFLHSPSFWCRRHLRRRRRRRCRLVVIFVRGCACLLAPFCVCVCMILVETIQHLAAGPVSRSYPYIKVVRRQEVESYLIGLSYGADDHTKRRPNGQLRNETQNSTVNPRRVCFFSLFFLCVTCGHTTNVWIHFTFAKFKTTFLLFIYGSVSVCVCVSVIECVLRILKEV